MKIYLVHLCISFPSLQIMYLKGWCVKCQIKIQIPLKILMTMTIFRKLIFLTPHKSQNHYRNQPDQEKTDPEETEIIKNEELPIGFIMELAQHSDVLNHFSSLSKAEQDTIIDKARGVQSHDEMRQFVESLFLK